jgi:integrase/recombinase XerD
MAKKKLPKIISREDAATFLCSINTKTITGLRNRVALQLMYRCGLRVSEVCNLTPHDLYLDCEYPVIHIYEGKGGVDRDVGADPETVGLCQKWMEVRPESEYFLCAVSKGAEGNKLSERQLRDFCRRLSEKTGIYLRNGRKKQAVHPHTFRHCCATERLEDGWDLKQVQDLLGHADMQTTSIYLHVRPMVLRKKMQEIPSVGEEKPTY